MIRHWSRHLVGLLMPVVLLVGAPAVAAQDGTPPGSSEGITLAASGLDNPRGFTWAADGTMYVAQAGSSPVHHMDGATPVVADSYTGTLSGSVVRIAQGCPDVFQGNLPSAGGTGGLDLGPAGVAILNGQVYVLDEGGGAAHGNPLTPDGIYAIDGGGSARLVADIGAWVEANPVAHPSEEGGDVVAMTTAGGALWVVESNDGQLLRVTPDGEIERVADLSGDNMQPHGIAAAPDGSIYVGFLTQAPYVEGAAKVVNITVDGTVTDAWTGLTAVTDVAIGPDGTLYALQLGTPDGDHSLSVAPNTGKVVRQAGPDSAAEVAVNIDAPLAMEFGPDQGLYVSTPAIVTEPGHGAVIRLNLTQGHVMTMDDAILAASPCLPDEAPTPEPTADATPAADDGTPQPATPDPVGDDVAVSIDDFAYGEEIVTVAPGTTVTWTNNDTMPHTVTATDGSFDSGNIAPGESFSLTFTDAGTFDYFCVYHPDMTATVVVE